MKCRICEQECHQTFLRLGGYCSEEHKQELLRQHPHARPVVQEVERHAQERRALVRHGGEHVAKHARGSRKPPATRASR